MRIETLEQIAALTVTAGLVAGNLLLFAPWRKGHEPRERGRDPSAPSSLLRPQGHPTRVGGGAAVLPLPLR